MRCGYFVTRPAGNKSISHRCYLREAAFEWELPKQTIYLPLGCLQDGCTFALNSEAASFGMLSNRSFPIPRVKTVLDATIPREWLKFHRNPTLKIVDLIKA